MKQLKFFTKDARALDRAKRALEKQGVDPSQLKVFSRDNSKHRYDGLLVQSENESQYEHLSLSIFYYVVLCLFGTIAIANHWVDFVGFSAFIILAYLFKYIFSLAHQTPKLQTSLVKTVYFVVINVDQKTERLVSRVTKKTPELIAQ